MNNIEEGQIVYVNQFNPFIERRGENLAEYRVTRVNNTSFYAGEGDGRGKSERRFDRRTMTHKCVTSMRYVAYLTAEEFYQKIADDKEKEELRMTLMAEIKSMTLDELRGIGKLIKGKGKK